MKAKSTGVKHRGYIILNILIAAGGGAALFKASRPRLPTPQQLQAAFPADTRAIFEQSEGFTLLSLDSDSEGYEGKDAFHGYRVIGKTQVTSEVKAQLTAAFYQGIADTTAQAAGCW